MNFWVESIKAVMFDLDDTLFDHKFSRLKGLEALQGRFPEVAAVPIGGLEREHEKLLSADYSRVLDGKVSIVDATTQRIRKLLALHGVNLDLEQAKAAADLYSSAYMKNRQAVPGSRELLSALKGQVALGLVSNGLVQSQIEKLRVCQIAEPLDFIVVSEAVGCKKPGREIFEAALERAGVRSSEAVYVGDSWETDVLPAVGLGMKAVWLNRYGLKCPSPAAARELKSFVGAGTEVFLKW